MSKYPGKLSLRYPHQFFFLTPRGTNYPCLDFSGHCELSFGCLVSYMYVINPANGIRDALLLSVEWTRNGGSSDQCFQPDCGPSFSHMRTFTKE